MMKLKYFIIGSLFPIFLIGQNVGFGTTAPDLSAKLDITSLSSGFLVPRLSQAQRIAIAAPANGLLVYQNDLETGYYYFNGTNWVAFSSSGWSLSGNVGTNPGTNYIGTTDLNDFIIRTNNIEAFRIATDQKVGLGTVLPQAKLHVSSALSATVFSKDFEDNSLLPLITSGNANWFTQAVNFNSGLIGAESGNINDSENSVLELTSTLVNAGSINFNYSTSTESCCDRLRFSIDGVEQGNFGGAIAWTLATYPVTAGLHTFRWEYTKDGSVSTGSDAVYIDDIAISESQNILRIQDGNEANGYVMLSDAAGNATWSDPTLFASPDDDWNFTSGSTNADPIHRTGNVLIGDDSAPGFNLHIYNGLADGTQIGLGSTEFITDRLNEFAISDAIVPEVDNSISIGTLANRWSQVFAVNGIIITSDKSLKEDIQPLNYGIKDLVKLETVHYQWKEERYGKTEAKPSEKLNKIGFLAQQIKTILPEVVEDDVWVLQKDGTYLKEKSDTVGLYYHEVVPVVIQSIKEHQNDLNQIQLQLKKMNELITKIEN
jgi:hypothetical protein